MNICLIPARGGSTRIPRKNIKEFHGKPIIAYSIETAIKSSLFDEIFVSADDLEIAGIAESYGAKAWKRSDELSRNEVGTYEVVQDFVKEYDMKSGDYICCVYATSPLMLADDLVDGYVWVIKPRVAHAISIGYPPLRDAAQFYWSRAEAINACIEYWWSSTSPIKIAPERVCDINTPDDWARAEKMFEALKCGY